MTERLTISAHLQPCRLRMRESVVRSFELFNARPRCSDHFSIRSAADESLMKVTSCRPILQNRQVATTLPTTPNFRPRRTEMRMTRTS